MHVVERSEGEGVRIGRHVLRVIEIHDDEVVFALFDPHEDGDDGMPPAAVEGPTC